MTHRYVQSCVYQEILNQVKFIIKISHHTVYILYLIMHLQLEKPCSNSQPLHVAGSYHIGQHMQLQLNCYVILHSRYAFLYICENYILLIHTFISAVLNFDKVCCSDMDESIIFVKNLLIHAGWSGGSVGKGIAV